MPGAAPLPEPVPAQAADLPALITVLDRTIAHLHATGIAQWTQGGYPQQRLLRDIADGHGWVWRIDGAIVAYGAIDQTQESAWDPVRFVDQRGRHRCLHRLFVDPALQRQGIGRGIMAWVEARAHREGWSSIRLDAFAGNPISNRMYTLLGFQERGRVQFGAITAIVYELLLPQA